MHARALLLVLGAVAALPSRGAAQPAGDRAQRLFDDGRRLLATGKIAEACAAFDASQRLDPLITTELNVAACYERNGQLATAWAAYQEAERMARAQGDARWEKVATSHAQHLAPRVSRLTISVPPAARIAGLEVLQDNEPLDPALWDHASPVDGGSYTIAARAPGHAPWSTTATIQRERDAQTIVIPALAETAPARGIEPLRPSAAASSVPVAPAAGASAAGPPVSPPTPSYVAPIALGAAALVLGGAGLGLELRSETLYDRATTASREGRTEDANSGRDAAIRDRYLAQALAVAAIGCAGVGGYLFVHRRGERRPAVAVMPVAASGFAGVAFARRW